MVGRWFFMIVGTIFSIMPAFVYWLAGYARHHRAARTAPTIGDIVAFTTLQSRLFFPLGQLLNVQVEVQGALALFDRIFEYLDLEPAIEDAPDAVALDRPTVRGSIRFRHVTLPLPGDAPPAAAAGRAATDPGRGAVRRRGRASEVRRPCRRRGRSRRRGDRRRRPGASPFALEDVDFSVEPGQLVALVGPSGSGKTTTTYLVPRLYDVDEGAVEIDGIDVRQLTPGEPRRHHRLS